MKDYLDYASCSPLSDGKEIRSMFDEMAAFDNAIDDLMQKGFTHEEAIRELNDREVGNNIYS